MRMSSQQPQQPTPSYADDDDCATSGSSDKGTSGNSDSDRQLLIHFSQALEYDRLQQHHTQRQLHAINVPPAARSGTADDSIVQQQSEPTTLNKDNDNHVSDARASDLSTHNRSPKDSLTLGYDTQSAQIREYNRFQQAHMQKKQQSRPHDQTGNVNMDNNISSNNDTTSDMASHPIRDTTHDPIEPRPNETDGDVGEGSPFGDLDVLESQLRERVHVSSRYSHLTTGDNVSSQNAESISQLGMASSVPSNCDNVGISAVALEAQLREYRKLHRSHIQQQQQQQFQPSRGIESIEEELS